MKMSNKKFTTIWTICLAVILVLATVVNIVLTGPLDTVMNMYFGKGDAIISNASNTDADTNYYKSDYKSADELTQAGKEAAEKAEEEGIVLLKNDNNTLPLTKDGKALSDTNKANISIFGRTSVDPIYTGAGSAATESDPVNYKTAFEKKDFAINNTLYDFYAKHPISTTEVKVTMPTAMGDQEVKYTGRGFISAMGAAMFVNDIIAEVPASDFTSEVTDSLKTYNDAAVVIIGRVGGEGCDLPVSMSDYADTKEDKAKSYLELNSDEISMLKYVKAQKDAGVFKKIVVVLNTANAMETGFLDDAAYGIDAAVWAGCLGDQGANAVASVLAGEVTPSGRLVDTYAYDLTADPSYQNFKDSKYTNVDGSIGGNASGTFVQYEEGIYVGYRYYETAAAEAMNGNYKGFDYAKAVQYPFGYGLSYADFAMQYDQTPVYQNGKFTFKVKVTNNSTTYSGKQVVQIYAEQPYTKGGIEKSKVVLAAFDKTDLLAPGKSQTLTLTVDADDLASYDYQKQKCYVLDAGTYRFYLSDNAHSWASIDPSDSTKYFEQKLEEKIYKGENKRDTDLVAATNQFDDVSAEFTDAKEDGKAQNMSRADFAGTFPSAVTKADCVASEKIKKELETNFDPKTDPQMGNTNSLISTEQKVTEGAKNGLSLIDMRGLDYQDKTWDLLLDELSTDDILGLLANSGFNTAELTKIGKPATLDYDGSLGWSTWVSANGASAVCTGFPAQEVVAATYNKEIAAALGDIVGEEGLMNGFDGWYAPSMDTHRSPFGGRNYEYFSEDGLLGGTIAAAEVSACMDKGTYCYIKHFALNDKEDSRMGIATFANEQAIREIYLKPFETCIKNATATIRYDGQDGQIQTKEIKAATAVMTSYNRIGTTWAGGNYHLITNVLRNEWGFQGMLLTDYYGGAGYMDPDAALRAGAGSMLNTFADGSLTDSKSTTAKAEIRRAAHDVLYTVVNSSAMQGVASGVTIRYSLAGWQIALIAGDIAVGIFTMISVGWILIRRKKNKPAITVTEK